MSSDRISGLEGGDGEIEELRRELNLLPAALVAPTFADMIKGKQSACCNEQAPHSRDRQAPHSGDRQAPHSGDRRGLPLRRPPGSPLRRPPGSHSGDRVPPPRPPGSPLRRPPGSHSETATPLRRPPGSPPRCQDSGSVCACAQHMGYVQREEFDGSFSSEPLHWVLKNGRGPYKRVADMMVTATALLCVSASWRS